jgi:glycosyltransferase involved in cell wall biosynthesis
MRIALVTNLVTHYRRPLFEVVAERHELVVFTTARHCDWYRPELEPATASDSLNVRNMTSPVALARTLTAGGYDGVILSLTGRATLLASFLAARSRGLPIVLWVGIWEHPRTLAHRLSRPIVRRLYRAADAVLVYGSHVARFVAAESDRRANIFVAPQAVDNDRFRARLDPANIRSLKARLQVDGRPVALFVGRLEKEKGVDVLLHGLARTPGALDLVVAGAGPQESDLRDLAVSLSIDDRVRFVGHIAQADLPALLSSGDFLVLPSVSTPSFREPWGLVVNEAMNCGLPVAVTDAVGAAAGGLVIDGETGFVVPERDVDALAQALGTLARDGAMRARMGEAARSRVLRWNYEAAADAFDAALAAASARRSR